MTQFLDLGPWIRRPAAPAPRLDGPLRTHVAVIGAGVTGLAAALELAERGIDVAVLERDYAGAGASGRHVGHMAAALGGPLLAIRRWIGAERVRGLLALANDAVDTVEDFVTSRAIDCDFHGGGGVLAAVGPKQDRAVHDVFETVRGLGGAVSFLDQAAMRERGLPPAFTSGMLEKGATLHPGKLVAALRRLAVDAGVALFEHTPVVSVEDGDPPSLLTPGGKVEAGRVLIATNAFTGSLGLRGLRRRVLPLCVTAFETEPLTHAQRARFDWRGREPIYTVHTEIESYQWTARGTIVGGTKGARYGFGKRLARAQHAATIEANIGAFRRRFPMLEDVAIAHTWSGWVACTTDFMPELGRIGAGGRIHYCLGYAGHGIPKALLLGPVIADFLFDRPNPYHDVLARKVWNWPPEPVRWLGARVTLRAMQAIDHRDG